jgi:hypothetical protein
MADDQSLRTVKIVQWPEHAFALTHNFSAREPVPVCISVCEPICAQSEYTIGIEIFDRPVAAITVRGMTRLFNCGEKQSVLK